MKFGSILTVLFIAASLVTGCGFRPLYQKAETDSGTTVVLDKVSIASIDGTIGQQLRNELIDRFYHHGYPSNAPYILTINLRETTRDIVIQKDDVTSRAQIVVIAHYSLTEKETRQEISKGVVRSVGSYNILGSQYATVVTRDTARDLALKELADKMALRVAALLTIQ